MGSPRRSRSDDGSRTAFGRLPRLSPRGYQRVCALTLFALAFIVVSGAAVRLTGSGLGCSDWPTCEQNQLVAALDKPHAIVEFVNRMITGLVSIAIMLAVLGSLWRAPRRSDLVWLSLGLVAGLIGQIVLGGITVRMELAPPFVMGHFILSMVLVWNAVVLHHRSTQPEGAPVAVVPPTVRNLGRGLCALAAVALFTGTMVTGAGPHGGDERAKRLAIYIPDIARVHSVTVLSLLGLTVAALFLLKRDGAPLVVNRRGQILVAAIVLQGMVGYLQYFTGVPPGLVLLHVLGATMVWIAVLQFHLSLWTRPEADAATDDERALAARVGTR